MKNRLVILICLIFMVGCNTGSLLTREIGEFNANENYQERLKLLEDGYHNGEYQNAIEISQIISRGYVKVSMAPQKSANWMKLAADHGYAQAQREYAMMLMDGYGVASNSFSALEYLKKSEKSGDVLATYQLGYFYANGIGTRVDLAKAMKYFSKNLEKDHGPSLYEYGRILCIPLYKDGNTERGIEYIKKAAEQFNYIPAQMLLASNYLSGESIEMDPRLAFKYTLMAANNGNAQAQLSVGYFYMTGFGCVEDASSAAIWWEKAGKQKLARAQDELAKLYYIGKGVKKDYKRALYWWSQAVSQNYLSSFYPLANMYRKGEGTKRDIPFAIEILEEVVNNSESEVMVALGEMYEMLPNNQTKKARIIQLYTTAAYFGNKKAAANISTFYERSISTEQDLISALAWQLIADDMQVTTQVRRIALLMGKDQIELARLKALEIEKTITKKVK